MLYNKIMRRQTKIRLIVFAALIVYYLTGRFFSQDLANICATIILLITLVKYCELKIKMRNISSVHLYQSAKGLLSNKNTLKNNSCIVKYFKNDKIIVLDNPRSKNRALFRAFIVSKTNCMNVSSCWDEICSVFNEYTYFDTLYLMIDKGQGRINILFLNPPKGNFAADNIESFISEPIISGENPKPNTNSTKSSNEEEAKTDDIEAEKIKQKNVLLNRKKAKNLNDLENGKKVYVNYSDAQSISILPGINIVRAKKIVAYRDIHGLFSSKEDFIKISKVKEHFESIIYGMISLEKYNPAIDADVTEIYGRIVDYQ